MKELKAIKKKSVTATQKKAQLTTKAFAQLRRLNSLNKVIEKATALIESEFIMVKNDEGELVPVRDPEYLNNFTAGVAAISKMLPYILPKQSEGNKLQVQINNNLMAGETTNNGLISSISTI